MLQRSDFFIRIKVYMKHYNIISCIKYSMCMIQFVIITAHYLQRCIMGHKV